MPETKPTTWSALRQLLVDHYDDLRRRLTRRLGSADRASEALHEVYLRLDRSDSPGTVSHPVAYLFRAAANVATDSWRAEGHRPRHVAVGLDELRDPAPGPDGIVESRVQLAALAEAIARLPPRQRAILIAARFEGIPRAEIAKRYRISRRMVQTELAQALQACRNHLEGKDA